MKKQITYAVLLATAMAFVSCEKTPGCMNPNADNYNAAADKDNGTCVLSREKFIGNYQTTGTYSSLPGGGGSVGTGILSISISSTGDNMVYIQHNGYGYVGTAIKSQITIANQLVNGVTVSGTIVLTAAKKVEATLTYRNNSTSYISYTLQGTKQ